MNGNKQAVATLSEEARAHVERTSRLRFRRSIIGGISAPIIFGLVVAFSGPLMTAALAGKALAIFGVALGAVMAVGALYLNSRLDSHISQFEQEYQAQQIAKGISGPAPTIEQKPITFPAQNNAQAVEQVAAKPTADLSVSKPTLVVDNVTNLGRAVAPSLEIARGHA